MKDFLNTLHARLGDLWWYSLTIFVACRSGDAIQAFIGLWLVPKYVGPNELGAVMPLQQLTGLFAVPLAILATVFAKYVNTYATRGEYGKVKGFVRDVLRASAVVFAGCAAVACLALPHFYVRLNVVSGALTALILASGLVGNVSSLLSNALQGLKRFRTLTVMNLVSAPVRLVTLLVAMPFRALSGFILGQTTPPLCCALLAARTLRRDLRAVPADYGWRRDLPEILRYLGPVAVYMALGTLFGTVTTTLYRQRLPEIESAAYYLLSRFSEIAGFIGVSMLTVLFPLASEAHEQGKENLSLLKKTLFATLGLAGLLAVLFAFLARPLLGLNQTWSIYLDYAYLLPPLTVIIGLGSVIGTIVTYEMACRRFGPALFVTVFNLFLTPLLVCLTGFEFFRGLLPDALVDWIGSLRIARLSTLTWINLASALIQAGVLFSSLKRQSTKTKQ